MAEPFNEAMATEAAPPNASSTPVSREVYTSPEHARQINHVGVEADENYTPLPKLTSTATDEELFNEVDPSVSAALAAAEITPNRTLVIKNLPHDLDLSNLDKIIEDLDPACSARPPKSTSPLLDGNGKFHGLVFVNYRNLTEAKEAHQRLQGVLYRNRWIRTQYRRLRPNEVSRAGGQRGGVPHASPRAAAAGRGSRPRGIAGEVESGKSPTAPTGVPKILERRKHGSEEANWRLQRVNLSPSAPIDDGTGAENDASSAGVHPDQNRHGTSRAKRYELKRAETRALLQEFIDRDPAEGMSMDLPPSLTGFERHMVHAVAAELDLGHLSITSADGARQARVTKDPALTAEWAALAMEQRRRDGDVMGTPSKSDDNDYIKEPGSTNEEGLGEIVDLADAGALAEGGVTSETDSKAKNRQKRLYQHYQKTLQEFKDSAEMNLELEDLNRFHRFVVHTVAEELGLGHRVIRANLLMVTKDEELTNLWRTQWNTFEADQLNKKEMSKEQIEQNKKVDQERAASIKWFTPKSQRKDGEGGAERSIYNTSTIRRYTPAHRPTGPDGTIGFKTRIRRSKATEANDDNGEATAAENAEPQNDEKT